jgi:transposase-like protein
MEITLKDIIGLSKEIPSEYFEETYKKLKEIKEKAESEKETEAEKCPSCESCKIVRNGKRHEKQAYICRSCGKTFVETSASAIAYSHSSETVWKAVIQDTVDGISLAQTAQSLDLSHSTAFNMRHKILFAIESALLAAPVELSGVCETDETYVLESVKGSKIPEDYHRKPRKHGAVASKPGISEEYICVCTSITGNGESIAVSVNRASPSKAELTEVFGDRITDDTLILCDGNKNYDVLNDKCTVAHTERINKVNGFHSFIKSRVLGARGFATKYLNRYNALFSKVFANRDEAVNDIYNLMTDRNNAFNSISTVKSHNMLNL